MNKLETAKNILSEMNINAGEMGSIKYMRTYKASALAKGNKHLNVVKIAKMVNVQFCKNTNRKARNEAVERGDVKPRASYKDPVEGFEGVLYTHKSNGNAYISAQIVANTKTTEKAFLIDGEPATQAEVDALLIPSQRSDYPRKSNGAPMINSCIEDVLALNGKVFID